jgi:photosystem II stability/assembly factor-like uncharacterized protein
MKKMIPLFVILIALVGCFDSTSNDNGDEPQLWQAQQSGTSAELNGLHFINETEGWVAGNNVMLHTEDGGQTWNQQTLPQSIVLADVHFLDSQNGWAVGGGTVLRTFDGGLNWQEHNVFSNKTGFRIHFTDSQTGFIAGISSYPPGALLATTTDAGTWEMEYYLDPADTLNGMQYYYQFEDIDFPTSEVGYIVGGSDWFLKTTDGGETWEDWSLLAPTMSMNGISFADEQTGWIVGSAGCIYKTTDGGLTWQYQTAINHTLYKVSCVDAQTAWAAGLDGFIVSTHDGGTTWTIEYDENIASGGTSWEDIQFVSSQRGYVVGTNGQIRVYQP